MRPALPELFRRTRAAVSRATVALGLCAAVQAGAAASAPGAPAPDAPAPGEFRAEIRGVDGSWVQAARAAVRPERLACDVPRWAAGNHGRRLQSALREQLRARGYYAPRFTQRVVREDACWSLTLAVDAGPRTRIRGREITLAGPGREDPDLRASLEAHPLPEGAPLEEAAYEALKSALSREAATRGYFDARFAEARIDVWPEEGAADVRLVFDTGPRYRFGALALRVEPDRLGDALVARITDWEPGAPYALGTLQALRRRLFDSGYFASIEVHARPEQREDGRVPVEGVARLQPRHELQAGIGFVTDLGPRVRASYENRHLNQRGHRANVQAEASPVLRELRTAYRRPTRGRGDPWLVLDAGIAEEETETAFSQQQSLGIRRIHGGPLDTTMTEFVDLQRESFEVAGDEDTAVLLVPGVSVEYADQWRGPPLELGWKGRVRVRGASAPLSTVDFLQTELRGELALPLGDRARLLTRVDFGTTFAPALADLPPSVRYFAGGDRSIRGYALDELGPRDDNGEVRGGRHLLVGSVELERQIRGNWAVAAFVDSGGAFNEEDDPTFTGVGFGARWYSPFGPVRIDLGFPLDAVGRTVRLHLGVGTTFR